MLPLRGKKQDIAEVHIYDMTYHPVHMAGYSNLFTKNMITT